MYQIGLGCDSFTLNFDRLNISKNKSNIDNNKSKDEFQHQVVSVEHIDASHAIMQPVQGNGYGFYDDFFAYDDSFEGSLNDNLSSSASSSFYLESNSSKQLYNDIESYSNTDKTTMTNSSYNIIYESHIVESTPLACRTFHRCDHNTGSIPINEMTCISCDKYRVIEYSQQRDRKQVTEYCIKLNINGADYVIWRSIDDIQKFISYCSIDDQSLTHFKNSLQYWNVIVKSRNYWWNMSSLIDPDYINKEHLQVKDFLIHLLFEIPSIENLFVLFN